MQIVAPLEDRPLRIVMPGGSGQIGQMLARHFQRSGHHVTVLTRGPYSAPWQTVHWDGETLGPWVETLEAADICINLTGHTINCRPTHANRQAIYLTRIGSTRLLHEAIATLATPPRLWMNASAATIYKRKVDAQRVDLPLDESCEPESDQAGVRSAVPEPWAVARGFIQRTVRDWESAFFGTETPLTRKIALRSGITLSPTPGNVFAVLSNLVRAGLGGSAGSGRQYIPWIHEADFAQAIDFLIAREDLSGPFNLTAPIPAQNRQFMEVLRDAWNRPNGLPAPAFAVWLGGWIMGSNPELVLSSCRAIPGRLLHEGFTFEFPDCPEAAEDLVRQWKSRR